MDEKILKYLLDIEQAITEIESYFLELPFDFFLYKKNLMLKRAIERNLEIIGESYYKTRRIFYWENF